MKIIGSQQSAVSGQELKTLNSELRTQNSSDPGAIAKQIETVFLNEFLKIMMEQTSFGKDRTVSTYMPYITSEIARSIAERGIGIGEFFLKGNESNTLEQQMESPESRRPSGVESSRATATFSLQPDLPMSLRLPVRGRITSRFGLRHDPIDGKLRHHNGIDIALPEGTPVCPIASGKVVFSGFSSGYGNCVIIEHDNGLTSLYAHNSVNLVKTGDVVDKNKIIALSGSTGKSTGPHLHFEVRKNGTAIDPADMVG